jgi:hypothetical protein
MPPTGPPRNPDGTPPPSPRKASPFLVAAVILGALLLVCATWLFGPSQKSISYDKFLSLVDQGQIAEMTLSGS